MIPPSINQVGATLPLRIYLWVNKIGPSIVGHGGDLKFFTLTWFLFFVTTKDSWYFVIVKKKKEDYI